MTQDAKLWIVRIPGPDDIYAAPSIKAAQAMKAKHDAWVTGWLTEKHAKGEALYMSVEDSLAVIEESGDAEEHAEMLTEFSYAEWGITEDDLREPEDASQAQLFREGGAA